MEPRFTEDYTTQYIALWLQWLKKFAGQPGIRAVEIGCFEGRSSIWFVENILQGEFSSLTCIDPWCRPAFEENVRPYRHKIFWIKRPSRIALRHPAFRMGSLQFAYVDGNHSAPCVLEDAVLVFPLLAPGGILIFDDYEWESSSPDVPQSMPKLAIDAFLSIFKDQFKIVSRGSQVCLEKL